MLDARLPDGSGIEVCRAIRAVDPSIGALILTSYDDDEALFAAIMAGAAGYVLKEVNGTDLISAIRHVADGKSLIDPALTTRVLDRVRNGPATAPELADLTEKELQAARLHRRGPDQPSDRRADVPGGEDRQELRLQHPGEARPGTPDPGGRARLEAARHDGRPSALRTKGPSSWGTSALTARRCRRHSRSRSSIRTRGRTMTAIHPHTTDTTADASCRPADHPWLVGFWRTLRIAFGLTFLWAFLDKTFALGFHTGYDQAGQLDRFGDAAWINGGSPTEGFLAFGADGPFKGFYNSIAGAAWADTLFMLGLLGIGLALTFGFGMRIATVAGVTMYVLMWTVVTASGEPPVPRRARARCAHHRGPGSLPRRRHLGPGKPDGQAVAGPAPPRTPVVTRPQPNGRLLLESRRPFVRPRPVRSGQGRSTPGACRAAGWRSARGCPGARWHGGEHCAAHSRGPRPTSPTPSSVTVSRSS